jgi:hypothetical protein
MYFVESSGLTSNLVGDYNNFSPKGIKVSSSYVYVLGTSGSNVSGIWRSPILDGGALGSKELVFDWTNAGSFSNSSFSSFVISDNNDFYVATDNSPDPILIINDDGTTETLYPGKLFAHSDVTTGSWQLVWGSEKYIYQYRLGTNLIYKIFVGKNSVPYYGRQ